MSTALAIQPEQKKWDDAQLAALRQIGLTDAPAGDLALFLHYSQRTGLDPFSRQIYMIGRWDSRLGGNRYTIQSSIDGLRIIAQRSGEYAGQTQPMWSGADGIWRDVWLEPTPPRPRRLAFIVKASLSLFMRSQRPRAICRPIRMAARRVFGQRCLMLCLRRSLRPLPCVKHSRMISQGSTPRRRWIRPIR